MGADTIDDAPLTLEVMAAALAKGCKPRSAMRIGAEHEKFGFHRADHSTVEYGGDNGIHAALEGCRERLLGETRSQQVAGGYDSVNQISHQCVSLDSDTYPEPILDERKARHK